MLALALKRRFVLCCAILSLSSGLALASGMSETSAASEQDNADVVFQRFSWQSPLNLAAGYLAGPKWTQGLRMVGNSQGLTVDMNHSSLGLKLPAGSAYLGLGYGVSVLPSNRLDFFAGVGLSVGTGLGTTLGSSSMNNTNGQANAYELTPQRGWRDTFGGLSLNPSASIGLIYRY
jgi:hypothetical protein